jgi:hypothetical protein
MARNKAVEGAIRQIVRQTHHQDATRTGRTLTRSVHRCRLTNSRGAL